MDDRPCALRKPGAHGARVTDHGGMSAQPHDALPITLAAKLSKNKRGHSWHVPVIEECHTPFLNTPPAEAISSEIERFMSPGVAE